MCDVLKYFLLIFGVITISVLTIVSAVMGPAMWLDSSACKSKARVMGISYEWGIIQGCMIEYRPGKWIDINNYHGVDAHTQE